MTTNTLPNGNGIRRYANFLVTSDLSRCDIRVIHDGKFYLRAMRDAVC
jgi:hypothetical protein